MGWKSIEMQVALPRTVEAGRIQEQLQRQGQTFQESMSLNQLEEEKLKRQRLDEPDATYKSINDQKDDPNQQGNTEDQRESTKQDEQVEHPYLGSKIDFSG